ncbi:hypothetical protein B0H10DRAFT_11930 [Mycena sp. CBHHK59/15]|nr:hypothetical protein B0H10DRAFT_11930 [Mycena sp. CBHHK59/15]
MATNYKDSRSPPSYDDASKPYSNKNNPRRFSHNVAQSNGPESSLVSEPRYVYYLVCALDGPMPSKTAVGPEDLFIGRVKATSIPPPHTVASLKQALAQAEGLPDPSGRCTRLYQTQDAKMEMLAGTRVAIVTGDLGRTPQTALALVFLTELSQEKAVIPSSDQIGPNHSPQYLYYRLYTRTGEEKSVCASDSSEPALGRIEKGDIAPPRNVLTIKRRIAKVEGNPIYAFADFFPNVSADRPQQSESSADDAWGSTTNNPILIVQPAQRADKYKRPLLIRSLQPVSPPAYIYNGMYRSTNLVWLSPSPGDIVYTDGTHQYVRDPNSGGLEFAYMAVDSMGKTGLVSANPGTDNNKFLDEGDAPWRCIIQ